MIDTIQWKGPYFLNGSERSVLFDADSGKLPGLYLWGTSIDEGFLVTYVGETGRSFFDRHVDHVMWWLSSYYSVFDSEKFAAGELVKVWDGIGNPRDPNRMTTLIDGHCKTATKIAAFLNVLQVLVAPFDVDRRLRRRAEGAIYRKIREDGSARARSFLQKGDRYWKPRPDESKITLIIDSSIPIVGLGEEIVV